MEEVQTRVEVGDTLLRKNERIPFWILSFKISNSCVFLCVPFAAKTIHRAMFSSSCPQIALYLLSSNGLCFHVTGRSLYHPHHLRVKASVQTHPDIYNTITKYTLVLKLYLRKYFGYRAPYYWAVKRENEMNEKALTCARSISLPDL